MSPASTPVGREDTAPDPSVSGETAPLEVFLFTHDTDYAAAALASGMSGVVVDWEWRGKSNRQAGRDTEINRGSASDLVAMRRFVGRIVCRINNDPATRSEEARRAVDLGADEVWLPMVRSADEVVSCLEALAGRAALGILAETADGIVRGSELASLPIARVYVGLNDLSIDTGRAGLFTALCDGAVDDFRRAYPGPLGFGGVTRPDAGAPVPCRLLLAEMARQRCRFAVARRSFRADVPAEGIAAALASIRDRYEQLLGRSRDDVLRDREALCALVGSLGRVGPGQADGA